MHSVTDRQTDGQQDDANSRSYCVAVRSAKNSPFPKSDRPHSLCLLTIIRYQKTAKTKCMPSRRLESVGFCPTPVGLCPRGLMSSWAFVLRAFVLGAFVDRISI